VSGGTAIASFINSVPGSAMGLSGFASWTGGSDATTWTYARPNFTLARAGTGYIQGQYISWTAGQSAACTLNDTNYIYINAAGILAVTNTDVGLYENTVPLFELIDDGAVYWVKKENHPVQFSTPISAYLHNNVGNIIRGNGGVIERVATGTGGVEDDIRLKISTDVVEDHGLSTTIPTTNPIVVRWYYTNGSGKWIQHSENSKAPLFYNNAGTPIALTAGSRGIYRVFVTEDSIVSSAPTFAAVMHSAEFANLALANVVINGGTVVTATNELLAMEISQLGFIVVRNSGTFGYIEQVIVQKNTINNRYSGGATSSSHLLLSDLSAGQYTDGGHSTLVVRKEAAANPTITDDTDAYKTGTLWVNTSTKKLFANLDNTDSLAIWKELAWAPSMPAAASGFSEWGGEANYWTYVRPTFTLAKSGRGYINGALVTWTAGLTVAAGTGGFRLIAITATNTLACTVIDNTLTWDDRVPLFVIYDTGVGAPGYRVYKCNTPYMYASSVYRVPSSRPLLHTSAAADPVTVNGSGINVAAASFDFNGRITSWTAQVLPSVTIWLNNVVDANKIYNEGVTTLPAAYYNTGTSTVTTLNPAMTEYAPIWIFVAPDSLQSTSPQFQAVLYSGTAPFSSSAGAFAEIALGAGSVPDLAQQSNVCGWMWLCTITMANNGGTPILLMQNRAEIANRGNNLTRSAFGYGAHAITLGAVAIGTNATSGVVGGNLGIAIGMQSKADSAVALGSFSTAYNGGVGIGYAAMASSNGVAIGFRTLAGNRAAAGSGTDNVMIGYNAGTLGQTGNYNIGIGTSVNSTAIVTGIKNISIGFQAHKALTSGFENVAIGSNTAPAITSGINNISIGQGALAAQTDGRDNVVIGIGAAPLLNRAGDAAGWFGGYNVVVGTNALVHGTKASQNIAIGEGAGAYLVTGTQNVAVGWGSAMGAATSVSVAVGSSVNCTASNAVAIGYTATTSGNAGIAIGRQALASGEFGIATGYLSVASAQYTVAVGDHATASGIRSSAVGGQAIANASFTAAFGYHATASGLSSTALGQESQATAESATALGQFAFATGVRDTAVGWSTVASGGEAIALGADASATGAGAIAIGRNTSAGYVGSVAIGYNTPTVANYTVMFGGGAGTYTSATICCFAGWSSSSDEHHKKNIEATDKQLCLDYLMDLEPITYKSKTHEDHPKHYLGFSAQHVQNVNKKHKPKFDPVYGSEDDNTLSLSYNELTTTTIAALQQSVLDQRVMKTNVTQLQTESQTTRDELSALQAAITQLQADKAALEARVSALEQP
jgi:hypothetical protein